MRLLRALSLVVLLVWLGGLAALGFQRLAWALGALLVALYLVRAMLGPRPRWFALRLWTAMAMLGLNIIGPLAFAPRIAASTAAMYLALALGAALAWAEIKDTVS